jgi:arylsulfatase A-like enzyme
VPGVIRTHIRSNFGYLSKDAVILPNILKKAGYNTALVGKWHLGLESPNTPNERGFDSFKGFLGDMMDDYYSHRRHGINYMRDNGQEIDPEGHATDLFTQWAVDYIEQQAESERPFLLYLAYNAPHVPVQPLDEWLARVKERENGIGEQRAKLVALIEHLDAGIGKVLKALEDSGQMENTLIIFTSDNGGQLSVGASNGNLAGGKGQMLEGGLKVPFVAVWLGRIRPATRSDRVALTMDIFATVCEAAGVKPKGDIEGRSFLPTLFGRAQPQEERFLFWVRREGGGHGGRAFYAARYSNWKLLQNSPFEPLRLYNLQDDPQEKSPLGSEHPADKQLFAALRDHIIRSGGVAWQRYPVDLPADSGVE